ncbi:hypothetical protein BGX29_004019 [Mortierella sp. GBA35]|nr:hypothetical protein BGX29_004019 [Mortierella sp. GBA35]
MEQPLPTEHPPVSDSNASTATSATTYPDHVYRPTLSDLPVKVLTMVAGYLSCQDIHPCILLSRSISLSFIPHLWRTVDISQCYTPAHQLDQVDRFHRFKPYSIDTGALSRYGRFVRTPRMSMLTASNTSARRPVLAWRISGLLDFRSLKTQRPIYGTMAGRCFLRLSVLSSEASQLCCERVAAPTSIPTSTSTPTPASTNHLDNILPNLKKHVFENSTIDQPGVVRLLPWVPALESLVFGGSAVLEPFRFSESLRTRCPLLSSLNLSNPSGRSLHLWSGLLQHADTLETLYLKRYEMDGAYFHRLLCSAPRLKLFFIVYPHNIGIRIEPKDVSQSPRDFSRSDWECQDLEIKNSEGCTQASGMDSLKDLKQLRRFGCDGLETGGFMESEEGRACVREYWPFVDKDYRNDFWKTFKHW